MRSVQSPLTSATFLALLLMPLSPLRAEEPTRDFPAAGCRYTLPGKDWSWVDPPVPHCLFTAMNDRGIEVSLTVDRIAQAAHVTPALANELDNAMFRANLRKRGGRFTAFQGRPCYQFEGVYPDGGTVVIRFVIANGLSYGLHVVGGPKPIEQDPNFEDWMAGLALAEAPPSSGGGTLSCFFFVAVGLILCVVLYFVINALCPVSHKEVPAAWRSLGDDFLSLRPRYGARAAIRSRSVESQAVATRDEFAAPVADEVARPEKTGKCRHCGHHPVAVDTWKCPWCGKGSPNPGIVSRYSGRGVLSGAILGAGAGGIWGFFSLAKGGIAGAVLGAVGARSPERSSV